MKYISSVRLLCLILHLHANAETTGTQKVRIVWAMFWRRTFGGEEAEGNAALFLNDAVITLKSFV